MAIINITVQSLLNSAQYDPYTVGDATTVGALKLIIQGATGYSALWFDLSFDGNLLADGTTLASNGIVEDSQLRTGNKIARLTTLEDRQVAKLDVSSLWRIDTGNSRPNYDIDLLPTKYSGNTIVDNPHPTGLIEGRPWI